MPDLPDDDISIELPASEVMAALSETEADSLRATGKLRVNRGLSGRLGKLLRDDRGTVVPPAIPDSFVVYLLTLVGATATTITLKLQNQVHQLAQRNSKTARVLVQEAQRRLGEHLESLPSFYRDALLGTPAAPLALANWTVSDQYGGDVSPDVPAQQEDVWRFVYQGASATANLEYDGARSRFGDVGIDL